MKVTRFKNRLEPHSVWQMARRSFPNNALGGFGAVALAGLLGRNAQGGLAHYAPKARSVIFLYMEGGPSQVDTFDYKPELQRRHGRTLPFDKPATVFNSYEQAARMQKSVPDVMDLSQESGQTQAMYGIDDGMTSVFGSRCLMARRLVERGVRFVEIFSPRVSADRWDQHGNLKQRHINNCRG